MLISPRCEGEMEWYGAWLTGSAKALLAMIATFSRASHLISFNLHMQSQECPFILRSLEVGWPAQDWTASGEARAGARPPDPSTAPLPSPAASAQRWTGSKASPQEPVL